MRTRNPSIGSDIFLLHDQRDSERWSSQSIFIIHFRILFSASLWQPFLWQRLDRLSCHRVSSQSQFVVAAQPRLGVQCRAYPTLAALLLHICDHYSPRTGFSNLSNKFREDLVATFPTFPRAVVRILMLTMNSIRRFLHRNACHGSNLPITAYPHTYVYIGVLPKLLQC